MLAGGCTALALPLAGCRGTAPVAAVGQWHTAAPLPFEVQEIYPTTLDSAIHVAGGITVDSGGALAASARHERYQADSQNWTTQAPLPEPRHHVNLVGFGERLYALGGYSATSRLDAWIMHDQTWSYDPADGTWLELSPAPSRHGETVCAALAEHLHVVGGRVPRAAGNARWDDHIDTPHHLGYDPEGDRWEHLAPALSARNSAAGAVIDDQWHVVGGRTVGGGNVPAHEVYDPAADRWRNAAPMPRAQGGLAAAALAGHLYAFGGEHFRQGGGVYPHCWRYTPRADSWEALSPLPTPRHGLGAAVLGNAIYVIGGATRPGAQGTSAVVEVLTT